MSSVHAIRFESFEQAKAAEDLHSGDLINLYKSEVECFRSSPVLRGQIQQTSAFVWTSL